MSDSIEHENKAGKYFQVQILPEGMPNLNVLVAQPELNINNEIDTKHDINVMVNSEDSLDNYQGKHTKIALSYSTADETILEESIIPPNKNVTDTVGLFTPKCKQLIEGASTLKLKLSLLKSKIEVGSNFESDVLRKITVLVLTHMEDEMNREDLTTYNSDCALVITKIMDCIGQQNVEGKSKNILFGYRKKFIKDDYGPESRGFVKNIYLNGSRPTELFLHAMGVREGLIDNVFTPADTDYIQRRLSKHMIPTVFCGDGTVFNFDDQTIHLWHREDGFGGDVLIRDIMGIPGTIKKFENDQEKMKHRRNILRKIISTGVEELLKKRGLVIAGAKFNNEANKTTKLIFKCLVEYSKLLSEKFRLSSESLDWLLDEIETTLNRDYVQIDETAEILAAQRLGELAKRMPLNTIHNTINLDGISSKNITLGDKMYKLIKPPTPVFLTATATKDKEIVKHTTPKNVPANIAICYELHPKNKINKEKQNLNTLQICSTNNMAVDLGTSFSTAEIPRDQKSSPIYENRSFSDKKASLTPREPSITLGKPCYSPKSKSNEAIESSSLNGEKSSNIIISNMSSYLSAKPWCQHIPSMNIQTTSGASTQPLPYSPTSPSNFQNSLAYTLELGNRLPYSPTSPNYTDLPIDFSNSASNKDAPIPSNNIGSSLSNDFPSANNYKHSEIPSRTFSPVYNHSNSSRRYPNNFQNPLTYLPELGNLATYSPPFPNYFPRDLNFTAPNNYDPKTSVNPPSTTYSTTLTLDIPSSPYVQNCLSRNDSLPLDYYKSPLSNEFSSAKSHENSETSSSISDTNVYSPPNSNPSYFQTTESAAGIKQYNPSYGPSSSVFKPSNSSIRYPNNFQNSPSYSTEFGNPPTYSPPFPNYLQRDLNFTAPNNYDPRMPIYGRNFPFYRMPSPPQNSPYPPSYMPEYSSSSPQHNPSSSPQYNPSSASQYNPSSAPQYNPSSAPQYNPSSAPQYNPSSASQYNPSFSPQYNPSSSPQYNPSSSYRPH